MLRFFHSLKSASSCIKISLLMLQVYSCLCFLTLMFFFVMHLEQLHNYTCRKLYTHAPGRSDVDFISHQTANIFTEFSQVCVGSVVGLHLHAAKSNLFSSLTQCVFLVILILIHIVIIAFQYHLWKQLQFHYYYTTARFLLHYFRLFVIEENKREKERRGIYLPWLADILTECRVICPGLCAVPCDAL